jgi:hypothetical protein
LGFLELGPSMKPEAELAPDLGGLARANDSAGCTVGAESASSVLGKRAFDGDSGPGRRFQKQQALSYAMLYTDRLESDAVAMRSELELKAATIQHLHGQIADFRNHVEMLGHMLAVKLAGDASV